MWHLFLCFIGFWLWDLVLFSPIVSRWRVGSLLFRRAHGMCCVYALMEIIRLHVRWWNMQSPNDLTVMEKPGLVHEVSLCTLTADEKASVQVHTGFYRPSRWKFHLLCLICTENTVVLCTLLCECPSCTHGGRSLVFKECRIRWWRQLWTHSSSAMPAPLPYTRTWLLLLIGLETQSEYYEPLSMRVACIHITEIIFALYRSTSYIE